MLETASETVPFMTREEVESRARDVLRSHSLDHSLETVPVDPVILANREGIKVHNAKFSDDNLVGMIVKRSDDVTMLVNHRDPPFRKRFTIAHELGHHFLHLLGDGEFMDREANLFRTQLADREEMTPERRREVQTNMFAAALLMPENHVRRLWEELGSVEEMARLFNVSVASMGIRIGQLGLG
jgi:Zn-dependent peptidase ImmA (M78 family)